MSHQSYQTFVQTVQDLIKLKLRWHLTLTMLDLYTQMMTMLKNLAGYLKCKHFQQTGEMDQEMITKKFIENYGTLPLQQKKKLLEHMFMVYVTETCSSDFYHFVSCNFLASSIDAMKTLYEAKKANLILKLSQCLEGSNPRMPIHQMPFGLLDYNIKFFSSSSTVSLKIEEHYVSWLATMYAHFGHKWLCLHRGPAWCYVSSQADKTDQPDGEYHNLIQEALEFSSIDLEASIPKEVDDNLLSEMNTSFNNLDLNLGELTPMQQIEIPNSSEKMGNEDVPVSGSHIWTSLSPVERQELELGLVSPSEMNICHKIIPKCNKTVTRNPDTFNPQKVIY